MNKWDGLSQEDKEHVKQELGRKLHFAKFAQIRFISALHGSGVGLLFKDILNSYQSAYQKFPTSKLTRLVQGLIEDHPPPLVNGRRIKLRYAHLGGNNPPRIIIHGNQVEQLAASYKRYLTNGLINLLSLTGTPLKIEFKSGENPYQHKKNDLSSRQKNKRKRLIKHIKKRSK